MQTLNILYKNSIKEALTTAGQSGLTLTAICTQVFYNKLDSRIILNLLQELEKENVIRKMDSRILKYVLYT